MAFFFGDGFDLYSSINDLLGYWDSPFGTSASLALSTSGRFAGSRGLTTSGTTNSVATHIAKTSGVNDAVHHISLAIQQTVAITGGVYYLWFTFYDGVSGPAGCSVVFRSDGAILLTSGASNGTLLATYTGAFPLINTWYQFEIEVVINSTTGSIAIRKLGNTINDFFLGSLNTRGSMSGNYASKIGIGNAGAAANGQVFDDFLWRSDAASVAWVGDIRCYTRMPASDVSVTWSRIGGATNYSQVSEAQQDGTTSYVYSSTVGQSDLYGIGAVPTTPGGVVGVTTRGYLEKSDAGTRIAAVQLQSGASNVQGSLTLNTTWGWAWRNDLVDPATSAAWTAAGINNAQIGVIVTT